MDLFGIKDAKGSAEDTRAPREAVREVREVVYKPPSDLEIPESVKAKFLNAGFKLRWVRYKIQGELDQGNIFRHQKEGAEFVKPDEVTELKNSTQVASLQNAENLVTIGDLALVKIPVEWAEARRKYYQEQSQNQLGTIKNELMKHNSKSMPISDESRSDVKIGKNAHFASD